MDKTIIIGVGGTGLEAIRSLRRRVVETHGQLGALPRLGFLYLDTDAKETIVNEDNRRRWEVLGQSLKLDESEFCIIDAPPVGPIVNNLSAFPQIEEWFPVEALRSIDQAAKDTPGASQIRPLGRFAFTLKADEVERKFRALYNRLPQADGGGRTHVYVICSLSGGTGSGMFLDLAYRIKEWSAGGAETFAFLVLPELTSNRGVRYLVNAYSALLELNYYNVGKVMRDGAEQSIGFKLPRRSQPINETPFDYSYLVTPNNEAGVQIALDTVPELIAHRIYLNFDSSFAAAARGLLNNGRSERTQHLADPFSGAKQSQNFFTFGLSVIQYPIEQITESFAYRIAADLINGWLVSREIPGNINERARSSLPDLKLTDDYLLGNRDFFGTRADFESYEREVTKFVDELKGRAPKEKAVAFVNEQERQFIDQFRSVGLIKFYQDRRDDLDGAVREAARLTRDKIAAFITDHTLGPDFADRIVEELIRLSEAKHQSFVDTLNGLPAKESGSRRTVTQFSNELMRAEEKLLFSEKARKEAMTKLGDALRLNLNAQIGLRAYEFGRAFLARFLDELKAIKENLIDWRHAIVKLHDELLEEIARRHNYLAEKMANKKEFNGTILFDQERIGALYATFDIASATRHVEAKLLRGEANGALSLPFSGDAVIEHAYRAALDWLINISPARVTDKNVADKLFEDYPDDDKRREVLAVAFRKSLPFLVFDAIEKQMRVGEEGVAYLSSATTFAGIAGLLDDGNGQLRRVSQLKRDIVAATNLSPGDLQKTSDTHQVLFLHETTAFPLRLIKDLKTLREKYDEYQRNPKAIPLHLQKQFDPPLMNLFLSSQEEIRAFEEAEEAFLLGWVEGKLRVELNQREEREEIRYRFIEAGSDTFVNLGNDWLAALNFCLQESTEARTLRQRLTTDIARHLKSFDTQPKKKELSLRLARHLLTLKTQLEFGEDNPIYQRYDRIRKRIVIGHNLPYVEVVAPDASPSPPSQADPNTPLNEVEERFLKLARTSLRSGQGRLTPAMQNMLNASQGRFGLTDAQAQRLTQMAQAEFSEPEHLIEYREMFEAFYEDGEITDDERALLIERQVELDLSDEVCRRLEESVIAKRPSTSLAHAAD